MSTRYRTRLSMLSRRSLLALAAPVFVIEPGREKEIVALFAPLTLGGEIEPGWRLMNIRVQQTYIEVELTGPDQSAFLRLDHPDATQRASERSPSFSITRGDNAKDGAGAGVATKVIDRLKANDRGSFWRTRRETPAPGPESGAGVTRSRGIVIPVVVTALVGALAVGLFVRRRRQR